MCGSKYIKGRLLTPTSSRYLSVSLFKNGQYSNKMVHRLVGEAFIPNPDSLPEINHKDSDTTNNKVSNLEWVTSSNNHNHSVANRKRHSYRRPVRCLETGQVFPSISAAGSIVNADATQVIESIEAQRCCKHKTFVYADSLPQDIQAYLEQAHARYQDFHGTPKMKNSKKVKIVETGQVFDSIAEAARFFKCDTATISNRIKAERPFDGATLKFLD